MDKYINADMLEKDGWSMQRIRQASPTEMIYETKKPTDFPAADVMEVRHGRWSVETIRQYDLAYGVTAYEPVYRCSCCGRLTESYLRLDEPIMPEDADFPKWCGECGAKMDEERENESC